MRIEGRGGASDVPLDDPASPAFLRLPAADLDDGRPLRRAAFDVWSDHLRAGVAAGRDFEAAYRAPRPFATALAMGGAAFLSLLSSALLFSWATRPVAAVQPMISESLGILVAVAAVVAVIVLSLAALVRAWRCRGGSYLHVSAYGLRLQQGGQPEPLANVASADWHGLVRCTRIAFEDGRPPLWLPAERGAMARTDLLLAALDDRLGERLRARL